MKSSPINYSPEMILARKAGRKTQTRRVMKHHFPGAPMIHERECDRVAFFGVDPNNPANHTHCFGVVKCPYGQPGDRLWVREEHRILEFFPRHQKASVQYRADAEIRMVDLTFADMEKLQARKTPLTTWMRARFMLRSLSRAEDEIVKVRVQRLQDISEADALAEGICRLNTDYFHHRAAAPQEEHFMQATMAYRNLWESIHGAGSWAANPFVWAITFQPAPHEDAAAFAVALPDTRGRHCYLTDGEGDPPRTYTPEHATSYPSRLAAAAAIIEARKLTPFRPRTMIVVPHPSHPAHP